MTRAVLVGLSADNWKLFRQPQWMAEVRRNPEAALLTKRYFDLEEDAYREALAQWEHVSAGSTLDSAVELLTRLGATEIIRP